MRVWVWVGLLWTDRVRAALEHYGDRITDVSIFGWHVDATGTLSEDFDPALLDPYREKWPHLRFWLAFRNDGVQSIFQSLLDSRSAQDALLAGLSAALDEYPWLSGVDIDLERGGEAYNALPAEDLFRRVAGLCHERGLECAAALPPLTATGSVGGENWVRYKQLGQILDHLTIMSYDFAWSGSAPGPVSPGYWMEDVYDWVTSQVDPAKVRMGVPLYSYFWDIHNYPAALGKTYRGASGTYYAAWQFFTGYRAIDGNDANPEGSGMHDRIGWLAFREPESGSAWGFLGVYDWRDAPDWDAGSSAGVTAAEYAGRPYWARYGLAAGEPYWAVVDNSAGGSGATYTLHPRKVVDQDGNRVGPKVGFTITAEILRRYPVAATILDDSASTAGTLALFYDVASGSWGYWEDAETGYSQYRGVGQLDLAHDFTDDALYMQVRGQFVGGYGWSGVTVRGITAEVHPSGEIRLKEGATIIASGWATARPVDAAAGTGRFVLGLRVRENTARVYFALYDTSELPLVLSAAVTPSGGTAAVVSQSGLWVDRVYVGDGWWYQPREAVEVSVGGSSALLGRVPRSDVTWDAANRFRPNADVDEWETRSDGYSLDWAHEHWVDAPLSADVPAAVRVTATDHDVWFGRVLAVNRDGAVVAYWSDAETVAHWRDRALFDYGLQGLGLWTLGQEDMRTWDRLAGASCRRKRNASTPDPTAGSQTNRKGNSSWVSSTTSSTASGSRRTSPPPTGRPRRHSRNVPASTSRSRQASERRKSSGRDTRTCSRGARASSGQSPASPRTAKSAPPAPARSTSATPARTTG
ncbi:hypothetical protein IT882_13155 [Microbacterium schleiferi]|uniref:GH18 domain-containing protein n=1 Tax=Microbacterium schleiferi TaxID=69362 RepID=A0A7S8MVQ2_9MICO|nr:glycosyl hydrolase family 18 protein [Microbacterium schleiferi]QPE04139.1 hypothetical protein IT882_13155 [Microbacterium schleiferi]